MSLQDKYKQLIDTASASGATDLNVREQDGVLYVDGNVPSGAIKDQLWNIYGQIDPDFRAGDLILNVNVSGIAEGAHLRVATESSNLNIRKGPGTDQPIVGKAAHESTVTLISKTNDQWWLIRTDDGVEGYGFTQYLKSE